MPLSSHRTHIDQIDQQIMQLLAQRMEIVQQIGQEKAQQGLPALDLQRWQEVILSRMQWAHELQLNPDFIKELRSLIHEEAIRIQK